jgi:ribonuclease HI
MPITHQRMEVTAAQMAVQWLKSHKSTTQGTIISDSNYVVKSANEDYLKWEVRNWRRADGKPVMYQELWRPLLKNLSELHPRPPFVLIPRKHNKKADSLCTMVLEACHPGCTTKTWEQVANAVWRAFEDWPPVVTGQLITHFEKIHCGSTNAPQRPHMWQFPMHTE